MIINDKRKYGDEQLEICSLDLSIDRSSSTFTSNSSHNFINSNSNLNSLQNNKNNLKNNNQYEENEEDESLCHCLCSSFSLCGELLSNMYKDKNIQHVETIKRPIQIPSTKFKNVSTLLNDEMAYQLYNMLPEASRLAQPNLVFSTKKDGWSMENLLAKTVNLDPVIILIKALKSRVVIGGYSTARISPPSNRIRGGGECFVFRLSPIPAAYYWTYIPSMKKESHNQFVLSCREYLAFGGSEEFGTNAIRLDSDLRTCDSGPSDTYLNPTSLVPEESVNGQIGPFPVENIEVIHITGIIKRSR